LPLPSHAPILLLRLRSAHSLTPCPPEIFMNRLPTYLLFLFFSVGLGAWTFRESLVSASDQKPLGQKMGSSAQIERGKYLVEEVAKCAECHTPRDSAGNLRGEAWLQGASIWIKPVAPIQNWADQTPPLAGLPSFTDAQMERVLEKGVGPEGERLRPPMHIYHMHPEEARAIIAYLKTLTPAHR
jgi:mono/diheme cytochrome c family protein